MSRIIQESERGTKIRFNPTLSRAVELQVLVSYRLNYPCCWKKRWQKKLDQEETSINQRQGPSYMHYSGNPLFPIGQAYGGAPTTFLISLKALRLPVSVTTRKKKKKRSVLRSQDFELQHPKSWNQRPKEPRKLAGLVMPRPFSSTRSISPRPQIKRPQSRTDLCPRRSTHRSPKSHYRGPIKGQEPTKIQDKEPDRNLETSPPSIRSVRLSEIPALSSLWVPIGKRGHRSSCVPHGSGRSMQI